MQESTDFSAEHTSQPTSPSKRPSGYSPRLDLMGLAFLFAGNSTKISTQVRLVQQAIEQIPPAQPEESPENNHPD
jgi:hypothetical protein